MARSGDQTVITGGMEIRLPAMSGLAGDLSSNVLPAGARLGEFQITGVLGEGGFGIVYLAQDTLLDRTVAIKEYMPASIAGRADGVRVVMKSERHGETFAAGLRSFVNEAKLLAQFDHPALVKVFRFWEAHGTAYMVMPFYRGVTVKHALREMRKPPDEQWLLDLLLPLLDVLELIHGARCYHRDVAPDNILILPDGKPLLLDFGAARRVIGDMTQALTVILKPGFAPIEQYAEIPGMRQGAWTDLYALAAVAYFAITGNVPPPSVARMMSDSMPPLTEQVGSGYRRSMLRALDKTLSVKPEQRLQTAAALRAALLEGAPQRAGNAPARSSASSGMPAAGSDASAGPRPHGHPRELSAAPPLPDEVKTQPLPEELRTRPLPEEIKTQLLPDERAASAGPDERAASAGPDERTASAGPAERTASAPPTELKAPGPPPAEVKAPALTEDSAAKPLQEHWPPQSSTGAPGIILAQDGAARESGSTVWGLGRAASTLDEERRRKIQRTDRLRALPIIGIAAVLIAVALVWWTLQPETPVNRPTAEHVGAPSASPPGTAPAASTSPAQSPVASSPLAQPPVVSSPPAQTPVVSGPPPQTPVVSSPVPAEPAEPVVRTPAHTEQPAATPVPVTQPIATAPLPMPSGPPLTAAAVLDGMKSVRDVTWEVTATADLPQIRIGRDKLKFKISSSRSGYVYIFMLGTDGQHVYQLFPNSLDQQNRLTAGRPMDLPRAGWAVLAGGPAGTDRILVMVSAALRDFSALRPGNPFGELEIAALQPGYARDGARAITGEVRCAPARSASCEAFGAAQLRIEEVAGVDSGGRTPSR